MSESAVRRGGHWGMARARSYLGSPGTGPGWLHAYDHDQQTVACGLPVHDFIVFQHTSWADSRLGPKCPRCQDIVLPEAAGPAES